MKTIEHRLAEAKAELALQRAEWERAKRAVEGLGCAPVRVPMGRLDALDAVVRSVHLAAGGVAV